MINFRPCGDCGACCEGHLIGKAYGNPFGLGKPCVFHINNKCGIHKTRPSSCRSYQCAWTQHLFPEWMNPNLCGVIISVENEESGKQFLRVIEIKPHISYKVYEQIENFCSSNNTYYVGVEYDESVEQSGL